MMIKNQLALILGRRSVRVYGPGAVTEAEEKAMIEAAMAAPSAMEKDPWRFVTVRKGESLAGLAAALPGGSMLQTAAMAILVCGDLEAAFEKNVGYLLQDCSAATQNLLLGAHAIGLGACWVGVYPAEGSIRKVRQLLNLPATFVPVAVVSVGRPGEELPPRTRYKAASVRAESW